MQFYIKHSLPGRIRIGYDKTEVVPRQAALAQSLLSVQEGITQVSVNTITGSFLVYYEPSQLSEKKLGVR